MEGYDELLGRWFGAGIEPLPLRADSEASRERINAWGAERTEHLIPDLLPAGFPNTHSVLVLVNALYLKANWARPFGKYPTEDGPFTRLDDSTVTVPLMHELELAGPAVVTDAYAEIDADARLGSVDLYLPRFESSTNLDLRDTLEGQLGVTDLFVGRVMDPAA